MKITAEPRSDQVNADDFVGGAETFTVGTVIPGKAEQKYDIELLERPGRAWRPPLTVLRVLIAAWGDDATVWAGRRVMLFRDETVSFGSDAVGGIRIKQMSHLPGNKPLTVKVQTKRGRRSPVTVEPLVEQQQTSPTADDVAACHDVNELREMWKSASPDVQTLITNRVAELNQETGA